MSGEARPRSTDTQVRWTQSQSWENPKPAEFGEAGQNWENVGWRVRVRFTDLLHKVRPKDHMDVLRRVLPNRYSPLQANGNGIQSIYLTEIPQDFCGGVGRTDWGGGQAALVSQRSRGWDRRARADYHR